MSKRRGCDQTPATTICKKSLWQDRGEGLCGAGRRGCLSDNGYTLLLDVSSQQSNVVANQSADVTQVTAYDTFHPVWLHLLLQRLRRRLVLVRRDDDSSDDDSEAEQLPEPPAESRL